jgi:hypothetical protein
MPYKFVTDCLTTNLTFLYSIANLTLNTLTHVGLICRTKQEVIQIQ